MWPPRGALHPQLAIRAWSTCTFMINNWLSCIFFLFLVTTNRKQRRWCSYRKVGALFLLILTCANYLRILKWCKCRFSDSFDTHYKFNLKDWDQQSWRKNACNCMSAEMHLLTSSFDGSASVQGHIFDMLLTSVQQERRWGRRSRLQWPSLVSRRLPSLTIMCSTSSAQRTAEDRWARRANVLHNNIF